MSDVEVSYTYDKMPTLFDVHGIDKYEKRDEKGGFIDGCHHRWCLLDDRNMFEKQKVFKYEAAKYDDIIVPNASDRKKGEPWIIEAGREKFMYMKRSKEENDKERAHIDKKNVNSTAAQASEFSSPGVSASHRFNSRVGPGPNQMKFRPQKSGR